jgi:hypothetical protein
LKQRTETAEALAREYLNKEVARLGAKISDADYERALRKATASFDRLQRAARLATKNTESAA